MTLKGQRQERSHPLCLRPSNSLSPSVPSVSSVIISPCVDLWHYNNYNSDMSPRTGRPRTGRTPNISLRMNPDAYHAARIEAVTARKTVGQWIEEAIHEKIEREKEAGNVTKADC